MKKRIITTMLLSVFLGTSIVMSNNVETVKANEMVDTLGVDIGYSINLAKHEFVDSTQIKTTTPIFANSWLQELTKTKTMIESRETTINYSNSFEGLVTKLEDEANLTTTFQKNDSLFNATVANRFNNDDVMNYSDNMYQYYSTYNKKFRLYSYELPNYATDLATYKSKVNIVYQRDVADLFDGDMTTTDFFDKYGTHIVAKAIYGGKFEINYSLVSNRYDVWEEYYLSLSRYLSAKLYTKIGGNVQLNFDVFGNYDFSTARATETLVMHTKGGNASETYSLDNLYNEYVAWEASIASNPVIIEASSDGLIPLWELLPSAYDTTTYKNLFIAKYNEYTSTIKNQYLEMYTPSILNEDRVSTGYHVVRPGESIITDDGIFLQNYDVMDLNENFDIKFNYMYAHEFNYLDIYLDLEIREINMGYQIIAYYYSEKEDVAYEIDRFTFEYEGTSLGSEYGDAVCFCIKNIPIETFINDDPEDSYKIVFRYSAEGNGEDDWANRDLYTNIVYVK